MKYPPIPRSNPERRGAALMLALLVLIVLVMVVFQISISTSTDARVSRDLLAMTNMEYAIESKLLEVYDAMRTDGEDAAQGGSPGAPSTPNLGGAGLGGGPGVGGAGAGGPEEPTDSSQDSWLRTSRDTFNEIELRVMLRDEDGKYNILSMLTENEDEADKAYDRVVRILDLCREGTRKDIDQFQAEEMATAMLEHIRNRANSTLPMPELQTYSEDKPDFGLPLSLREFIVLEPFEEDHFLEGRDEDFVIYHSISAYLTIWTSVSTLADANRTQTPGSNDAGSDAPQPEAPAEEDGLNLADSGAPSGDDLPTPGAEEGSPGTPASSNVGGGSNVPRININRAPPVVLKALMDDRDVPPYFWDNVIEYRNEEEEDEDDEDEIETDDFGDEYTAKKIFASLNDLNSIDGWENLEPIVQTELRSLLGVQSNVFSVIVSARKLTGREADSFGYFDDLEAVEEQEEFGSALSMTVRSIVWRRAGADEVEIVPLERWELLECWPYELRDFTDY